MAKTLLALAPYASVVAALVAALFGAAWLNRRNIARLTKAQAGGEDAKTAEMVDRMAREWLKRLDDELKDERIVRVYAIAYIERLLQYIKTIHPEDAGNIPALPDQLLEYLGR